MVKSLPANAGDMDSIPGWRKRQPTPVFLPRKPMDRGAWWATVHGVTKRVGHDLGPNNNI